MLVAPEATVTDDGTVTAESSLVRLTVWPPPSAAALSVAVQVSVPAPVTESLWQVMDCNAAVPVPLEVVLERLLARFAPPHASRFTERKDKRSVSNAALSLSRLGASRLFWGETIGFSEFLLERDFSKRRKVVRLSRVCFMY